MTTFAMPGNLKVAIIGPASFHPLVDVALYVRGLPKTTTILSGGDSPLDTIVVKTANEQGLALVEYPADWDTYGNHAEFIRDDKLITATDDTIYLEPGTYQIKIVKDGYAPWEKTMSIEKELVAQTNALLFPSAPSLTPLTFTVEICLLLRSWITVVYSQKGEIPWTPFIFASTFITSS